MNNKQQIINRAQELGFKFIERSKEYMELVIYDPEYKTFADFILKIYTCKAWNFWNFHVEFESKRNKLTTVKHFNVKIYTLDDFEFFYQYYLYISTQDFDSDLKSNIYDIIKNSNNSNWEVVETCRIYDYVEYKLTPTEYMGADFYFIVEESWDGNNISSVSMHFDKQESQFDIDSLYEFNILLDFFSKKH